MILGLSEGSQAGSRVFQAEAVLEGRHGWGRVMRPAR